MCSRSIGEARPSLRPDLRFCFAVKDVLLLHVRTRFINTRICSPLVTRLQAPLKPSFPVAGSPHIRENGEGGECGKVERGG